MRAWLLAVAGILVAAPTAFGGLITITDTQPILDFPFEPNGTLPAIQPFALYDFSGQPKLADITGIEITMTMQGGDTAPGDFDFGNLSLGLDNVPTGILFNGFPGSGEKTLTFSLKAGDPGWLSEGAMNDLLMDLKQDNQLFGLILDATPDNNCVNLYSFFDTTIKLTGNAEGPTPVPEPASWLIWGLIVTEVCRRLAKAKHQPSSAAVA